MDIVSLRTFLALADTGSFSRAAESLHVTQPAISKRIAALEFSLDTRLFDRVGKRVQLTESGRALLPGSRRIIAEIDETQRVLSNIDERTHGVLSMATSHHIGLHRLPAVLREYRDHYPDVQLDIHSLDSDDAFPLLLRGELELAVVTLPADEIDQLSKIPLWSDPMQIVVASHNDLFELDKLTTDRLIEMPVILQTPGTYTRELVESALGPIPRESIVLESSYLETIKAMVQAGLGWSVLPESMIDDSLTPLMADTLALDRHLGVVIHRERTLSNAANRMLETLGVDAGVGSAVDITPGDDQC